MAVKLKGKQCKFIRPDPEGEPLLRVCVQCGREVESAHEPENIHAECGKWKPGKQISTAAKAKPRPIPAPEVKRAKPWTIGQKLASAAKSAKRILKDPKQATAEVRDARLAICNTCPELRSGIGQCSICECFVGLKSSFAVEKCPLKKWPGDNAPTDPNVKACGSCGDQGHRGR